MKHVLLSFLMPIVIHSMQSIPHYTLVCADDMEVAVPQDFIAESQTLTNLVTGDKALAFRIKLPNIQLHVLQTLLALRKKDATTSFDELSASDLTATIAAYDFLEMPLKTDTFYELLKALASCSPQLPALPRDLQNEYVKATLHQLSTPQLIDIIQHYDELACDTPMDTLLATLGDKDPEVPATIPLHLQQRFIEINLFKIDAQKMGKHLVLQPPIHQHKIFENTTMKVGANNEEIVAYDPDWHVLSRIDACGVKRKFENHTLNIKKNINVKIISDDTIQITYKGNTKTITLPALIQQPVVLYVNKNGMLVMCKKTGSLVLYRFDIQKAIDLSELVQDKNTIPTTAQLTNDLNYLALNYNNASIMWDMKTKAYLIAPHCTTTFVKDVAFVQSATISYVTKLEKLPLMARYGFSALEHFKYDYNYAINVKGQCILVKATNKGLERTASFDSNPIALLVLAVTETPEVVRYYLLYDLVTNTCLKTQLKLWPINADYHIGIEFQDNSSSAIGILKNHQKGYTFVAQLPFVGHSLGYLRAIFHDNRISAYDEITNRLFIYPIALIDNVVTSNTGATAITPDKPEAQDDCTLL